MGRSTSTRAGWRCASVVCHLVLMAVIVRSERVEDAMFPADLDNDLNLGTYDPLHPAAPDNVNVFPEDLNQRISSLENDLSELGYGSDPSSLSEAVDVDLFRKSHPEPNLRFVEQHLANTDSGVAPPVDLSMEAANGPTAQPSRTDVFARGMQTLAQMKASAALLGKPPAGIGHMAAIPDSQDLDSAVDTLLKYKGARPVSVPSRPQQQQTQQAQRKTQTEKKNNNNNKKKSTKQQDNKKAKATSASSSSGKEKSKEKWIKPSEVPRGMVQGDAVVVPKKKTHTDKEVLRTGDVEVDTRVAKVPGGPARILPAHTGHAHTAHHASSHARGARSSADADRFQQIGLSVQKKNGKAKHKNKNKKDEKTAKPKTTQQTAVAQKQQTPAGAKDNEDDFALKQARKDRDAALDRVRKATHTIRGLMLKVQHLTAARDEAQSEAKKYHAAIARQKAAVLEAKEGEESVQHQVESMKHNETALRNRVKALQQKDHKVLVENKLLKAGVAKAMDNIKGLVAALSKVQRERSVLAREKVHLVKERRVAVKEVNHASTEIEQLLKTLANTRSHFLAKSTPTAQAAARQVNKAHDTVRKASQNILALRKKMVVEKKKGAKKDVKLDKKSNHTASMEVQELAKVNAAADVIKRLLTVLAVRRGVKVSNAPPAPPTLRHKGGKLTPKAAATSSLLDVHDATTTTTTPTPTPKSTSAPAGGDAPSAVVAKSNSTVRPAIPAVISRTIVMPASHPEPTLPPPTNVTIKLIPLPQYMTQKEKTLTQEHHKLAKEMLSRLQRSEHELDRAHNPELVRKALLRHLQNSKQALKLLAKMNTLKKQRIEEALTGTAGTSASRRKDPLASLLKTLEATSHRAYSIVISAHQRRVTQDIARAYAAVANLEELSKLKNPPAVRQALLNKVNAAKHTLSKLLAMEEASTRKKSLYKE